MPEVKLKKNKVFVAMSGGVDSAVAAFLLKKSGFQVTGVYMKNWSDPLANYCPWEEDIKDFILVCKLLKIPYRVEIFEEQYRQKVVKYLINGYKNGSTPNPDMICNKEIKFKLFLKKALQEGANFIATGHYVIKKSTDKGFFSLYQATDSAKDQSYFLSQLNQRQLKHSLFPVGIYKKTTIRQIAKNNNLPIYNKKDSQGICFIGKVKFKDFIQTFISKKPGFIKDLTGNEVGRHNGLSIYTIGQRHGLGIGGGVPYYVVKKNIRTNTLIVAKGETDSSQYNKKLTAKKFNWILGHPPKKYFTCQARIRYRQPLQSCLVSIINVKIILTFRNPQRAITPGQFVVLYKKHEMLGGGVIN